MKNYRPLKKETEPKPKKLSRCGHVEVIVNGDSKDYEMCKVLTSRQIKLTCGKSISICPSHERLYKEA